MRQQFGKMTFHLRSAFYTWWGFAAAGAFAALVSRGFFMDLSAPGSDPVRFLVAAALCVLLAARVVSRVRDGDDGGTLWRPLGAERPATRRYVRVARDLEVGLLLVVATHAVLQLAGGLESPFYPLLYALACFLVAVDGLLLGGVLVLASLGLEAGLLWSEGRLGLDRGLLASHAAFCVFFAAVGAVFLRTEVARLRKSFRSKVTHELSRMRREAADFRLFGVSVSGSDDTTSRDEKEGRLLRGSVESIHQTLFYTLEMLKESLGLQSCVLLWLDESGTRLHIKEAVSDSDMVTDRSVASRVGLVGGVLKTRATLHLCPVKQPASAFPYYRGPETVGAFIGIPVVEGGYVRGVLCGDRKKPETFGDREETTLRRAADQILRAIKSERLFCVVERSKYEQERFFKASEMLNRAWGMDQVFQTAFSAAREIVEFDTAAITLYDATRRRHEVAAVQGEPTAGVEGLTFSDNSSLVAMAVKNRHYLPLRGNHQSHQVVFTKKHPLKEMRSVLVMPLIGGDKVVGTFVLGAARPELFTQDKREMLRVIGNQVAVTMQNARMVNKLEEMATTDGLTGLLNHRTFQDRLSQMMARANRSGRKLSMLLTDIDHFKSVNDTYGHPVGDEVLKQVSKVLADTVRTVDMVARYGGEEFAVVLEETDADGALLLAERIRTQVAALRYDSDQGPFSCTLSLGIAVYPEHGEHKQLLVEHADQALYRAKEGGRNRAVLFNGAAKKVAGG